MTREENLVQLENLRRFCEFCSKQRTRMLCREDVEALQFAIDLIKKQESEKESNLFDKIISEIMNLDYETESVDYDYNDMTQTEEVHIICREEVLQIIDRYKAESEVEE